MKITKNVFVLITLFALGSGAFAQQSDSADAQPFYRYSVETSPASPFLQMADAGIWGIKLDYALSEKDELKVGLAYMNLHFDEGTTHAPSLIVGYRRFLWKKLYLEYELWPGYDKFYEKNEGRYYESFDIWNEFRVGYQFNFEVKNVPAFVSVTWPFGFGLYSSNKPESFYDRMNQSFGDKYFYQFPLIFVGVKF